MGRHPEVGEDPVHAVISLVSDVIVDEAEIAVHRSHPFVIGNVGERVAVPVDDYQAAVLAELRQNRRAVPASAESSVDIYTCRIHTEG